MSFRSLASGLVDITAATQATLAAAIGAAVPIPPSAASIGLAVGAPSAAQISAAGQHLIDTPGVLESGSAPTSGSPFPGSILPVSNYLGWQMVYSETTRSGHQAAGATAILLQWFQDSAAQILVHEEWLEIAAQGGSSTYVTDRHHGPYMRVLSTSTAAGTVGRSYTLIGTNRPIDRFRAYTRVFAGTVGDTSQAQGTDNVLLAQNLTVNAGTTGVFNSASLSPGPAVMHAFASAAGTLSGGFGSLSSGGRFAYELAAGVDYQFPIILPRRNLQAQFAAGGSNTIVTLLVLAEQD